MDTDLRGIRFLYNNVKCTEDSHLGGRDYKSLAGFATGKDIFTTRDEYSIPAQVSEEILTTLRAGLALNPPQITGNKPIARPVSVLYCPKDGGAAYLNSLLEISADKLNADIVRLDSQDLAILVANNTDENLAWNWATNALLAYNAHKAAGKTEDFDKETQEESVEEDAEADEIERITAMTSKILGRVTTKGKSRSSQNSSFITGTGLMGFLKKDDDQFASFTSPAQPTQAELWTDLKLTTVLDTLVNAPDVKRARLQGLAAPPPPPADSDSTSSPSLEDSSVKIDSEEAPAVPVSPIDPPAKAKARRVIIQVADYNEIMKTKEGPKLLTRLRSSVDKRWQDGTSIIFVGTTTTNEENVPIRTKADLHYLQSDITDGEKRTIYVPLDAPEKIFEEDEKVRIRRINIRHVEDMVLKMADAHQPPRLSINIEEDLDIETVSTKFDLGDSVWNYPRVHRTAITILGGFGETETAAIKGPAFIKALEVLADSDTHKVEWLNKQIKDEDDAAEAAQYGGDDGEKKKAREKIKELKKKCNTHEKKLLSGVVFPSDIRTTFTDIRAPKEVTDALKTLTSLSLLRPDAFSYGVLSTDKIPGVLLYGPPGTGKTLLAKAVAKESGANVLEISAADVNDMFVGQGEKNVKAIFTLAKKLSPCVVFIDEADAIFSARSQRNRNAHRETINQFLREWDGMTTDLSAFIMLATNRPFDLDEAVLRRLPRRLLIDLPVEKDREAILKIHLKDEVLEPTISLAKLAKDTPFYSGSDLKNVCVAAALACVREENATAAAHEGEEAYVYPEKRTLTEKHFTKALEEISASISEDMSTLTAIRKFDEKYGDRKGRKKKGPVLGFGGTRLEEKDSEAAMVRKLEA